VLERLIWLPFSFSFAIFIVGGDDGGHGGDDDDGGCDVEVAWYSKLLNLLYVRYLYSCVPMRLTSNTIF
jgi:hypothetical protein